MGGSYFEGGKEIGSEVAEELAMRGYAVFSISYRLTKGYNKLRKQDPWFDT